MTFATLYNLFETANFAKTSTTTLNKLDVIDWENQQFKRAMPTRGANETVIGVVGNSGGLERHIRQYLDLGFKYKNIYLVDLQSNVASSLRRKAEALEQRGTFPRNGSLSSRIFHEDILIMARKLPNVTHIDFDGTASIKNLVEFAQMLASISTVKSFCIVVSARAGTKQSYEFGSSSPEKAANALYQAMKQNKPAGFFTDQEISKFKKGVFDLALDQNFQQQMLIRALQSIKKFSGAYKSYLGTNAMVSYIFVKGKHALRAGEYNMTLNITNYTTIIKKILNTLAAPGVVGLLGSAKKSIQLLDYVVGYIYRNQHTIAGENADVKNAFDRMFVSYEQLRSQVLLKNKN